MSSRAVTVAILWAAAAAAGVVAAAAAAAVAAAAGDPSHPAAVHAVEASGESTFGDFVADVADPGNVRASQRLVLV